jgi:NADPH2:quinone reductase
MKAWVLGVEGPELQDRETPRPRAAEVVVRVHACALNRVDLAMARGHVHGGAGGAGAVLGVEWAGEVVEAGPEAVGIRVGERVMGSGAGAFAEYAVADVGRVALIPDVNLSFQQAATLPVALQTMHDAVVTNGALAPGQSVLILGASSGVGLMGLQIARTRGASLVAGSSTTEARRKRLAEFGADLAIDTTEPDWSAKVLEATNGAGVDLIVDQVSGPGFNEALKATRIGGRIVNVGRLGGERAEFNFDLHALRRITYIGVTFRTRSRDEVRQITRRMKADLWPALESGDLSLPIDATFAFGELPAALAHMRGNQHFGKIVVRL